MGRNSDVSLSANLLGHERGICHVGLGFGLGYNSTSFNYVIGHAAAGISVNGRSDPPSLTNSRPNCNTNRSSVLAHTSIACSLAFIGISGKKAHYTE